MSNIPIVINNFNRLSTTKNLVEDLLCLEYTNIHILDNDSSYPPLLIWYSELKEKYNGNVKLFNIGYNSGQLALWNTGYIERFYSEPYMVYTDSDIELNENTPKDFLGILINYAKQYGYDKVGLALKIDDLPETDLGSRIRNHESKFWTNELIEDLYKSDIDTTFAVIKPTNPFDYKSLRVAGKNIAAKHIPWYTDWRNMSEEEKYILDHLDNKFSTYKGYYLEWLAKQAA